MLARCTQAAGITASISPHTLRHFLFTWLKTQGIADALIQPYSGHTTRQFLKIYSRHALANTQQRYDRNAPADLGRLTRLPPGTGPASAPPPTSSPLPARAAPSPPWMR
jgi:hypothetical protein